MSEIAVIYETATGEIRSTIGVDRNEAPDGSTAYEYVQRQLQDAALGVVYLARPEGFPDPEVRHVVDGTVVDK